MVERSGEGTVTKMAFDNDIQGQPLRVVQSLQEAASFRSKVVDETNIISMEKERESGRVFVDESEVEDDVEVEDEKSEEYVDIVDVKPSSRKRRKIEASSNMIGATKTNEQKRVIIQMECEENNPDDGFRWRKYGQKAVKGNSNPRSYFKCTMHGCMVKKHVERGASNAKIVVITYDGIHEHARSDLRDNHFGPRNRSGSSVLSQNGIDRTGHLGESTPLSFSASLDKKSQFLSLEPQFDMTELYMNGLSKMLSLPINHKKP